jgi:hypothetical protein
MYGISGIFLLIYHGRKIAKVSPIAARMYNSVIVLSGIENLFEIFSANSMIAKQPAKSDVTVSYNIHD